MVLSSAPLPPADLMTTEPGVVLGEPQPRLQVPQAMAGQLFFGQNQQGAAPGGVQGGMQFTPQHTEGVQGGMHFRPQGVQFKPPEAGGVQFRPQLQNRQEHFAWNVTNTTAPQKPLAKRYGDSPWSQQNCWNPLQSRMSQNRKSPWNLDKTVQTGATWGTSAPQATGFGSQLLGASAADPRLPSGNLPCSGTFGTLPAQTYKEQQHKQHREITSRGHSRDRRVPSGSGARGGAPACHRRRKRPSSEDEGPSSKMFLSEEKMAAHLNRLSISNDHAYVAMGTRSKGSPSQDKNRVVIEDLSDDSSDEWASSDSEVGSTIQLSPELQQSLQQATGERLLPEGLFERLNRPCMEVVLWKPPGDFVSDVMKTSSLPKKQITPTSVPSVPLLLTAVNPDPSPVTSDPSPVTSDPVTRNHGEPEMIDAEVLCHVPQPDVTMFDSVDDDMEL